MSYSIISVKCKNATYESHYTISSQCSISIPPEIVRKSSNIEMKHRTEMVLFLTRLLMIYIARNSKIHYRSSLCNDQYQTCQALP